MSNRKQFYFRERVTEAELNAAFDDLEDADHHLAGDLGFVGVLANAQVSPHAPVPDLTVDLSGPGIALDQLGRRIFFSGLQTVNVAQDDNGVSTDVSADGKERVVSVFVQFDRALSDPRIDGNSATVFFEQQESFRFLVAQGPEAAAGAAAPPALRSDALLLADVTRRFGQAQITGDVISTTRRQDAFVIAGKPRALRRGTTVDVASDLLGFYNAHVGGTADRHAAAAIDFAGGGAWADGGANPAATVEQQLDKLVADLAGAPGAAKIGAAATSGAPAALNAGSVKSQLDALLGFVNGHLTDEAGAHAASAIAYAGGGAWKDGTANPATSVEAQFDKLVADLAADAGAARVGVGARTSWRDGRANPAGVSLVAALDQIVTDLSDQTAAADGAARIGAQASGHLATGSVRSQLDELDATSVRTDVANVFAATQTMNGVADETVAAIATTAPPATRKLLWQIAGTNYGYRLYSTVRTLEFVLNARWDGGQWVKDSLAFASSKLELNNTELRVNSDDSLVSPFPDSWASSVALGVSAHGRQSFDAGANWLSAGPTDTYIGWRGATGTSSLVVGAGSPFRKQFPVVPSSITFSAISTQNISGPATATAVTTGGVGVLLNVTSLGLNTFFFITVFAS